MGVSSRDLSFLLSVCLSVSICQWQSFILSSSASRSIREVPNSPIPWITRQCQNVSVTVTSYWSRLAVVVYRCRLTTAAAATRPTSPAGCSLTLCVALSILSLPTDKNNTKRRGDDGPQKQMLNGPKLAGGVGKFWQRTIPRRPIKCNHYTFDLPTSLKRPNQSARFWHTSIPFGRWILAYIDYKDIASFNSCHLRVGGWVWVSGDISYKPPSHGLAILACYQLPDGQWTWSLFISSPFQLSLSPAADKKLGRYAL